MRNVCRWFSIGRRRARYRYVGRYRSPSGLGRPARTVRRRSYAVSACFRLARARRSRAFAIRGGVQCYLSSMTTAKFTRRGRTRVGGLKVYVVSRGNESRLTQGNQVYRPDTNTPSSYSANGANANGEFIDIHSKFSSFGKIRGGESW